MMRLGLIGKKIQHSMSPTIYKDLINTPFKYDLLDIDTLDLMPTLKDLSKNYDGVNITSPYKKYYVKEVILSEFAKKLNSINCLKFRNGLVYGENTDYLAARDLLKFYLENSSPKKVFVLGDGVMSNLIQHLLREEGKVFEVFSRKGNVDFYALDFTKLSDSKTLIINTCSREYVFNSPINNAFIFWNLNYNQKEIESKFHEYSNYVDGLSLLKLQAKYAVDFWSTNN